MESQFYPREYARSGGSLRSHRNERDLSLKLLHGADPFWLLDDCVSQGPDPVFKPLCLHHHQVGVISGVCHRSHTLKSTEEMRGKLSCIRFMAVSISRVRLSGCGFPMIVSELVN